MSRDFGFKFHFHGEVNVRRVLDSLEGAGWKPDDHGSVNYLVEPDFFEWESMELANVAAAYGCLSAAQEAGLSCAIMLTWEDTQIGGSFIFMPSRGEVILSPLINTVHRSDFPILIDFEWYLGRLAPAFGSVGISGLEMFDFAD